MPQLNQWVMVDRLTHGCMTLNCLKQTKPETDEYQFELRDMTDRSNPVTRRFLKAAIHVPHAPIAIQLPYTHWSNWISCFIDEEMGLDNQIQALELYQFHQQNAFVWEGHFDSIDDLLAFEGEQPELPPGIHRVVYDSGDEGIRAVYSRPQTLADYWDLSGLDTAISWIGHPHPSFKAAWGNLCQVKDLSGDTILELAKSFSLKRPAGLTEDAELLLVGLLSGIPLEFLPYFLRD